MVRRTLQGNKYNTFRPRPAHLRPKLDPNGDFDDMGRGEGAALYHYEQKRKHGRF